MELLQPPRPALGRPTRKTNFAATRHPRHGIASQHPPVSDQAPPFKMFELPPGMTVPAGVCTLTAQLERGGDRAFYDPTSLSMYTRDKPLASVCVCKYKIVLVTFCDCLPPSPPPLPPKKH